LNRVIALIRQIAVFVDRWHWLLLALATPFLLFPSPSRSVALLVVPGLWIIAGLAGREPLPRTPLNATLLVMFIMVLVSTWATFDIAFSLPKIAGMVLGIGVFYAFVNYGQRARGWYLCLGVFLAAGLGVAALGLVGTQWTAKFGFLVPITSRLPRAISGLPGAETGFRPNEVAGALLWVLPTLILLTGLLLIRPRDAVVGWGQRFVIAAIPILVVATLSVASVLLLTQSRGGYIGLGLTAMVLVFIALPSEGRWLFGSLMLFMLIGGVAVLQYQGNLILQSLFDGGNALSPTSMLDTLEGRAEVWSRAIYGIQDFPFTGMGMNTFRRVVHVLYPLFLIGPDVDFGHAHNEFLQVALDLGIPGLMAFLALYIGAFWILREMWGKVQSQETISSTFHSPRVVRMLVLGLGGGLLAHMVYGLTDAVALGAKPSILFWMLLGLVAGLYQMVRVNNGD